MANDNHAAGWFRYEYDVSRDAEGKRGDELRLAMFQKGIGYLKHIADNPNTKKKDLLEILKMIEYSQGWIDRTDGTNE